MIRLRRLIAACVAVAGLGAPVVDAALPSAHSLGAVRPTPSGVVNSKYRNGDDGTAAIPLLWGTCPALATTTTASDSFNLRTLCNLIEAGSPTSTLSLLSGTLPAGCVMATDGIDCTTPTAGSASVVVRATRATATADVVVNITVTTAGTDSTAPTVPLGLVATDNADGTGVLSWDASSDPSVSGIATGVASYRVRLGGVDHSTIAAPSANVQPVLAQVVVGASDNESSAQDGADWTLTFGGGGLVAAGDHVLGRLAAVTGDFVATAKITSYAPTSGTTGSIGIAARASTAANVIAAYARWKDSDDQCNLRYRWQAGSMSNGTDSAATYTLPVWIRLSRSGDTFSAACSSDGNTWVTTSSHTISPGATLYVGPFITSGSAGDAATGTVAQFNVHQGSSVSAPITASGSYTVSSYDGTNRSSESAAVTATVTGGEPDTLVTVPAATATVCNSGCTYTPSQLAVIVSSAANATANGIAAGSSIELRADSVGGSTTWPARLLCSGVSGTSGDPIWVAVRDGDQIMLNSSTSGTTGLIDLTDCDYWNIVGSRDGGTSGLQLADRSVHGPTGIFWPTSIYTQYPNARGVMIRSSTGVALVGFTLGGSSGYGSSHVDIDSTRILFKYADIGRHGSNVFDFSNDGVISTDPAVISTNGDSDTGEILNVVASKVVYDNVYQHHSGHTQIQPVGPHQVIRNSDFSGDWTDILDGTAYEMFTGNHEMTILPQRNSWGSSTYFGPLIENTVMRGVGSEPEHKLTNEAVQLNALNPIVRGNYVVLRAGADGHWGRFGPVWISTCSSAAVVPTTDFSAYIKVYNNVVWGGGVFASPGNLPGTKNNYSAPSCGYWSVKNNLFQGQQPVLRWGSNSLTAFNYTVHVITNGSYAGHTNAWKGSVFAGNIFGRHPTDPQSAPYWKVYLGSNNSGSGTGTAALTDSTTWPSNWYGNTDQQLVWSSGTTLALANFVADAVPDADAIRAALVVGAASSAAVSGQAVPMTTVAAADSGTGTTLVLDDARWIYDGWDIDEYTWGGLHQERADCIAIGATAATATVVGVDTVTDLNYTTHTVTLENSVSRNDGDGVWPATRNSNGTCGAIWDNVGAAQ